MMIQNDLPRVVVLGNFDGVHRGHLALLARAREEGARLGLPVLAYTFRSLPQKAPLLCDPEEKEALLLSGGADGVFSEEFARVRELSPERFVQEELIGRFRAAYAVCGFNFRFGKDAAGGAEDLVSLMGGRGSIVEAVRCGGDVVSSTRIRSLLTEGRAEEAAFLMTRPYSVTLPVLHGKRLGRTLGFPTANQRIPAFRVMPKHGVYRTEAETEDGRVFPGISNLGSRPTVNGDEEDVTLETYIDGLSGSLYDRRLTVRFLSFMREQRRFDSVGELREQLEKDIRALRSGKGEL